MSNIVEREFKKWTRDKGAIEARISVYENIRDIPYAIVPELIDHEGYTRILTVKMGSCTPKHFLLCAMFQRLGMTMLYACYPFRWDEVEVDYPRKLLKMAEALPTSYHLACKVDIDGRLVLVDATLDLAMEKLDLPVNKKWDGNSDTLLPMKPCGEEELYHPSEARYVQAQRDEKYLVFYNELNSWLTQVRKS